jgi:hypothetical protein
VVLIDEVRLDGLVDGDYRGQEREFAAPSSLWR